jgi:HNH endonuclease
MSSCILWKGAVGTSGYGVYYAGERKNAYAHRRAYEQSKGAIPKGLFVCHTCDIKLCVNPEHLWLGTNLDNIKDMQSKGRNRGRPKNISCPTCNSVYDNYRNCRLCANIRARENYSADKRHSKYLKTKESE